MLVHKDKFTSTYSMANEIKYEAILKILQTQLPKFILLEVIWMLKLKSKINCGNCVCRIFNTAPYLFSNYFKIFVLIAFFILQNSYYN